MNESPHKSRQNWICKGFMVVKVKVYGEKKKKRVGKEALERESPLQGSSTNVLTRPKLSSRKPCFPQVWDFPSIPPRHGPAVDPSIWLGAVSAVVGSEHRN